MKATQLKLKGRPPKGRPIIDPAYLAIAEALRINDAAGIAGLSRATINKLIYAGQLPSRVVAGRRLVLRTDLNAFLRGGAA